MRIRPARPLAVKLRGLFPMPKALNLSSSTEIILKATVRIGRWLGRLLAVTARATNRYKLGTKLQRDIRGFHVREKSSSFGLEAQLLGHSACEHGDEKSRHYRSRDLLYCGVSLRQPRPRLHPRNAHA
jgi:hypothetical protein